MKKFFVIILSGAFFLSCAQKGYEDLRVVPVPESMTISPGNDSFIVLRVEIPRNGHIYGNPKGPGTGKPTEIFVQPVPGITTGPPRFLEPKKFYFPGEKEHTWGYEHETRIYLPLHVETMATPGMRSMEITFDSLLCADGRGGGGAMCLPEIRRMAYPVRISPRGGSVTRHDPAHVAEFMETIQGGANDHREENGNAIILDGDRAEDDIKVLSRMTFAPRYFDSGITGLIQAILFGIMAGLILNVMPCVLPVVSLKILGFVRNSGESRKALFFQGLSFSLGILASFGVLAVLAAYFGYAWGGLFQQEVFIVGMAGLVFAFALSLLGVFTINPPSFAGRFSGDKSNRYTDAFVKGLLATLLATPCSGPFLGGTLAWALTQSPAIIAAVFMSIGAGMALPYLVLTTNPAFMKWVPRPGEWTRTFESIMGLLLVFTTIYLLGLLEPDRVMPSVTLLGFIAMGLWQYGEYGAIHRSRLSRVLSVIMLVVIVSAGYCISFRFLYEKSPQAEIERSDFSIRRMVANRDDAKISVINFTAEWCPNCKLVESVTLGRDTVVEVLDEGNVDYMVADITTSNPAAERLMELFGSRSIPLLAVVPPGKGFKEPIILRDIYSPDEVVRALAEAEKHITR